VNIRFSLVVLSLVSCAVGGAYAAGTWVFVNGIKNDSPYAVRVKSTDAGSENRIDGRAYYKEPYVLRPHSSVETRITVPWQTYGGVLEITVLKNKPSMKNMSVVTLQDTNGKVDVRGDAYVKNKGGNSMDKRGFFDKTKDVVVRIMKDGLVVIEQV